MRISSKEINELQNCVTSLEAFAMELRGSGMQSYIQHAKKVEKRASFLDKFVGKLINSKRR